MSDVNLRFLSYNVVSVLRQGPIRLEQTLAL